MKLTIVGCTLLLCSTLLYGFRFVTAAILNAGSAINGPGLVGMEQAFELVGWLPQAVALIACILGILCIGFGLRQSD